MKDAEDYAPNNVNGDQFLVERARRVLRYYPETGELIWAETLSNRAPAGTRAGNMSCGYREISIDGVSYKATTVIWLIVHGRFPDGVIDHRDGSSDDDRLFNLREASYAENAWNTRTHRDNKSGFKGVTLHAGRKKPWQARIYLRGRNRSLGYYFCPEEANAAYARAAAEAFGEFARAA